MKILLIKALAESHLYSQFVNSLHRAFDELGHEPVITDESDNPAGDPNRLALELQRARYDAVLSFSSFFGGTTFGDGTSLFDVLGVKFLGWQFDHPIYVPQSLGRQLIGRYSIYSNDNHLKFVQALNLPGRGVVMLPGVDRLQTPAKPYRSRAWSIFVAATWNGHPTAVWESLEDSPAKFLIRGVIERLLADREASLLDAFNDTSDHLKLGARLGADPAFDDQMIGFLRAPLTYFRHLDRINIIKSLADSGLPLTILGTGWRDFLGDRGNVIYLDYKVDLKDLPSLYGDAKLVVNLNAGNGACERALHSAMAGAAVVSDYSEPLARLFHGRDDLAFFNRAKTGDVAEVAGQLIESERGEAVAQQGHKRVLEAGLWNHRAAEVVEFLNPP